ncbi:class I SAM-dependent methyltransferase [Vibrio scophthalmi]|uniref:dTDP-3-amino-3,4, 6-trideoxy-alpha-D-glucopyranose n=2 Tax=Vibrio scophthalmi TaxID=45658 RepID=A0A1B1NNE0_9VIBR|nr:MULTISPECIES: class I SAM-dependent methyltransferase [Vibrio]ANS85267.1 dTDP-3-amino-3,4,6-trideoxy-alpha-D-glucopyranose [Vibrio scophthalmi]ANU36203.1 dTDP-3-amino-3,4,6-trideoxy-alpha-D-glucopyranose [Vibrio scophthalmi]EGU31100.1 methyltransferase type 11 [Vibrio sp. N418]EGU37902.1 methyltransferase type 11 [Vibrio scophthalmi LMG 19158]ODS11207.1 dTDP-3-amino-3,4,6-trideoxy-alpha-D-glucopyranose [Vibrio scophthalmi]
MRHRILFEHLTLGTIPSNALYTDLSGYYDLMCADIDYQAQSRYVRRLHQLFGNEGKQHLDLACGTGPHIRHFLDFGYQSSGLDLNQPMLDLAKIRCPEAEFMLHNMCNFTVEQPLDLITCFLYSIHYSDGIENLKQCIAHAHAALAEGGMFCFNSVNRNKIDNRSFVRHSAMHDESEFIFSSGWKYSGEGEQQFLTLSIEKHTDLEKQLWNDEHPMVAVNYEELSALLEPYFEVHIFEHDYEKILPWDGQSGNAFFACVKR